MSLIVGWEATDSSVVPSEVVCEGESVPSEGKCEGCGRVGTYVFVGKSVTRGAVVRLDAETIADFHLLSIPLARCRVCGRWARVLPAGLLPRKSFGHEVIEKVMRSYLFAPASLRKAVRGSVAHPQHVPHYSTLHH